MVETLEQAREFFLDPSDPNPDSEVLAQAASVLIRGIEDKDVRESENVPGALDPLVKELAHDYATEARHVNHKFMGHILPSDSMLGLLAQIAAGRRNNNTVVEEVSPLGTRYEKEGMEWMLEHVAGYDKEQASGALVSGGSSANLTALAVARERLEADGWHARRKAVVFASRMAHYSVTKAAGVLAPGNLIQVSKVPLEENGYRMDPAALEKQVRRARLLRRPIMGIVAVAGETETGLVDDLDAFAEIAERHNIYLHVDGAYGAPYRMSRQGQLFEAMSRADSITTDPHKQLFTPYSSGAVMFKDVHDHARIQDFSAEGVSYLFHDAAEVASRIATFRSGKYLGSRRLEGSMSDQAAAALYMTSRYLGEKGIGALLDHTLDLTEAFADEIKGAKDLRMSCEPELNTVCVEPVPNGKNLDEKVVAVAKTLDEEHGIFMSTTSLPEPGGSDQTHKVLRVVPTHPYTREADVRDAAKTLQRVWANTEG